MKSFLGFYGGFALFVLLITLPFMMLGYYIDKASCHSRWEGSKYESSYGIMSGCRIKKDDAWIPEKNLRDVY